MGTNLHDFVALGIDISDKWQLVKKEGDKFNPYIYGHKGIDYTIIRDIVDEEFMYFGIVLAHTNGNDGFDNFSYDIESIKEKINEITTAFNLLFDENYDSSKCRLVFCSYWR